MSDSGGGVGQFVGEIKSAAAETLTDAKDGIGEAIEQGAQSVTNPNPTPQQIQQKQLEDQTAIAEQRRIINFNAQLSTDLNKAVAEDRQNKAQRIQSQEQDTQAQQQRQMQSQQRVGPSQGIRQDIAENMSELRGGRKGG